MKIKDIAVSAAALMVIGGAVTAALAGTNALTAGTIADRMAETENAARLQVIDADSFEEQTLDDGGTSIVYYRAVKDGQTAGYVFTTVTTGKSGGLTVMTGLRTDGTVSGVMVTSDNETAGYVDKVRKAGLLDSFKGREAAAGFRLGETVDGVSQATKTSRGIIEGVDKAARLFEACRKEAMS
ncbi:MAG: FMN-binding protein [Clostridiales bacterium]|nr:FMN-binding protein [Clostridiales bacterium]